MILHVLQAEYRGEYKVRLSFNDGTSGTANLAGSLNGSMFEALRDKRLFRKFRVDPEIGTIVWENGADLAPEYLKGLIKTVCSKFKGKSAASLRKPVRKKSEPSSKFFRSAKKALTR